MLGLPESIDMFELIMAVVFVVGLVAASFNLRAAWGTFLVAIAADDIGIRLLGFKDLAVALVQLALVLLGLTADAMNMTIPSAIQEPAVAPFQEVVTGIVVRIVFIGMGLGVISLSLLDTWLRHTMGIRARLALNLIPPAFTPVPEVAAAATSGTAPHLVDTTEQEAAP